MRKVLPMLGLILLAALFFTGMVLGSEQTESAHSAPESLPAIGEARGTDLSTLMKAFGADVPHGPGGGEGYVTDAEIGSLRARLLMWQGADGLVTGAVRPAEAAQLLRREGMTLDNSALWTLGGQTLLMASGDGAACAYYDDGDTAYSLYMENTDIEQLLAYLAARVTFPQ